MNPSARRRGDHSPIRIHRGIARSRVLVIVAVLATAGTLIGAGARAAVAATPSVFATIDEPVGVAAANGRLLVTQDCSSDVSSIDSHGNVSTFASLPVPARLCQERYIAVSPGLGHWPLGWAYVTQNHRIYQISPDGLEAGLFAKIPALPVDSAGITFDTIGDFGYDMIVTGHDGTVYRVNAQGVSTLVASSGVQVEGPNVAPRSFAPYGGDVLLATKFNNEVLAVDPSGAVSVVTPVDHDTEQVAPLPPTRCDTAFGGAAWFLAEEDAGQIVSFPTSDFAGLSQANALAQSELQMDIFLLTSNGTSVSSSTFSPPVGTPGPDGEGLEGSAFANCGSLTLSSPFGAPGATIGFTGTGYLPGETVGVTFDGTSVASTTANGSGGISGSFVVPAAADLGAHNVVANGSSSGVTEGETFTVPTNWPMFHNLPTRTGVNTAESIITRQNVSQLTLGWTGATGGPIRTSPVVANGQVFVGSDDGTLTAFPTTCSGACAPNWTVTPHAGFPIESTPAVAGGMVFVGADDGKLYAYKADTGAFVWSATTTAGDPVRSSPLVSGNAVYVGSDDGKLYDFKASSGALVWAGTTTAGLPVRSSPALLGTTLYIGADDGNVYAFPKTCSNPCSPLWVGPALPGTPIRTTPTILGTQLYVGAENGKIYSFPTNCTNPCTRTWVKQTGGTSVDSSPAAVTTTLWVGSSDGKVYALNPTTGATKWTSNAFAGAVRSSPAEASGVMYVGADDGNVYAFSGSCSTPCSPLWTGTTTPGLPVSSSPAISDGVLYVGADDGTLFAFRLPQS